MKRLISGLTAFCMCASMVVGTLPASALNTGSTEENVITAGTPSLGVKDVAVASGEEAAIEVTISDAVPLNSFTLNLLIDGENVDTFTAANGGTGADAEVGPVYEKLTSTAFNPEAGKFAATLQADEDVTGSDGDTLLVFYLDTKGIQDGKYTLSLEGVKLGDSSRNEWTTEAGTLTTTTGILTIGDVPEDATTAPTPTQAPTQAATQAATSAPTPEGFAVGLKDVTVAKSGDEAIIEVIVNDPVPFNSFTLNLQIDGKSLDAFGGTGTDAEVGEVYEKLSNSAFNPAVGKFAANYQADDDVAGSTGDTLLVIYFDTTGVPDGEYVMSLDGVKIGNSNRDEWTVGNGLSTFTGILKIGDTDTPTEAEEPTQAPTVAPSGMSLGLNDVTVKAGEEAVIEFAIKNPEPLNSFTATLLIDGKSVDVFGGTGTDAEVGTVYEKLSNSAFNPAVGKFAANYQADDDVAGADGDVLLNFYFDTTGVPAGEYTMSLEGVKIGNSNRDEWTVEAGTMSTFTGILTILDEEPTDEPTEEPTEAPTEEPTDEPTEAPTEAPTDAPTEAPTEAPTDAPTEEPFTHVTQDTDAQWVIGTTTVEAGEDAVISVSVNGDTDGLNSYIVRLAQDAGPVLKSAEQATAYAELGFEKNTDNLVFGGTNFSTKENVTGDGDVITLTFSTDDLEPGIYNVTFVDDTVEIYNVEMVQLVPKTQNGWIEIVAPETTPEETDAPTEAPTEAETEAETEDIVAPEWIIGTATVEAGEDATITVAVTGDTTGLNSYIVKLSQDAGPVLKSAEQATAYAELGFEKNMEALTFGGTNFSTKTNVTGEGDVITLTFGTDDLEPGIYNVVFVDDTVEIYTVGMNQVVPNTTNGWIEIVAPETTPEETDAPTEPETDAPTEPETDAPTEAPTEPETENIVAPAWIIGTTEVYAGEDAVIAVSVNGDTTGLNSYIVRLSQDAGPVLKSAEQATAYAELGFEKNIDNLVFGGTNFSTKTNVTGEGDVITLTFGTDGLEPGLYNVVFVGDTVEIYTVGMNQVVPETTNGWIRILAPDETPEPTEEPTEAPTEEPTEPETDAPTEPETEAPTEPETEAPTEPETDAPTEPETDAPTEPETDAPTEPETDAPTEAPTEPETENIVAPAWIIGTTEVYAGEDAVIAVSVNGDTTGLNSYIVRLSQDAGPVLKSAEQATAYAELGFEKNIDALVFGGTNFSTKTNVTGEGDVITLTFGTDGLEPGLYNVVFVGDTVEIYTVGMNQVVPETTNGWIRILAPDETPAPTEEPTEAPTEEPTEPETDAPTEPETDAPTEPETDAPTEPETDAPTEPETDAPTEPETDEPTQAPTDEPTEAEPAKWIIGTTEVYAGEDAVIAVSVTNDTVGLNSYVVRLTQDAGPVLKSAEQATAYAELGFEKNLETMVFGGTSFGSEENIIGNGDVITLTFDTTGVEPGLYNVRFVDGTVEIYDVAMNPLVPETEDGWIRILAPDETLAPTEEPTEAPTEEPTEAPTEEPTEEPATDEPTQEPATDEPTQEPATDEPTQEPATDEPTQEPATDEPTQEPATDEPTQEPATDEPTQEPATDEPTQGPTDGPNDTFTVKWDIGDVTAKAGEEVLVPITISGADPGLNNFSFTIKTDDGISYVGYTDENGVFHDMIQITNPEGLTFEGVSVVGGNVAGEDGDVILNLRFTVPEDAVPGTVYAIDFDGAVTATRADGTPVEVITEGGSITVLPNDIGVVGYRYRITGKHHFYFAHDVRPFNPADLINTIYYSELYGQVDENGDPILDADGNIQYVDEETQNDLTNWTKYDMASDSNITFTFADEWASPKTVYDREVLPRVTLGKEGTKAFHVQRVPVQITLNGVTTSQELGLAYIGVKGDTSLNGFSNANDAAFVLRYAAAYGAKRDVSSFFLNGTPVYLDENMSEVVSNEDMESFVYFLSDVTAESEDHGKTSAAGDTSGNPALNANDASFILLWAAKVGAKLDPNWGKDVLTKPIPKYTQEINDYIDAHPELG